MLSRVADSLFWLGRYVERAENYARFIEVNFNLSIDLPPGVQEQWKPLITITGDSAIFESLYSANYEKQDVIRFLTFDKTYENSILRSIEKARENARTIRESISREAWEHLNNLYYYVQNASRRKIWEKEHPREFFATIKSRIFILYGLANHTELRTEGWHFNNLGLLMERADKTSRILDVKYHILLPSITEVGTPIDYLHWAALLRSIDAFNAFKRVYGKISPSSVLEFSLLNPYFSRSTLYCVSAANDCLREISGNFSQKEFHNPAEKKIGALKSELEFKDVQTIIDYGVHEYVDDVQLKLNDISNAIHDQYFEIVSKFTPQKMAQE